MVARIVSDSSSCRAFAQRHHVGRMKHIDAKYLSFQDKVKAGDLEMEGVATVLNVADVNTKKLAKAR